MPAASIQQFLPTRHGAGMPEGFLDPGKFTSTANATASKSRRMRRLMIRKLSDDLNALQALRISDPANPSPKLRSCKLLGMLRWQVLFNDPA